MIDIAPTVFDFAGLEPPAHLCGRSLKPTLSGKAAFEPRPVLIEVFPDQTTSSFVTGFVRDQHKLVVNTRKKLVQLFELHDEKNDIAQSQPEKLRQYEQQMKEFLVARGLDPEDYFP